jgi:hypothetical protein
MDLSSVVLLPIKLQMSRCGTVADKSLVPPRNVRFALSPRKVLVTSRPRVKLWRFRPLPVW